MTKKETIKEPEKHLKLNLKALLEAKNMSRNEFVEKTGFTYVSVSAMVNGQYRRIGFETLERICHALDCDITELLVWE